MGFINWMKPGPHVERLPDDVIKRRYPWLRFQVFASAFLGYTVFYLLRSNNLATASKNIQEALDYSKTEIGMILAVLAGTYAVAKFLVGSLSDRSDPRKFMAVGLLLTALCNFAFGSMQIKFFAFHMVIWGLNGLVQAMGWVAGARAIGHWFSVRERGLALNGWDASTNLGGALSGVLAAWSVSKLPGILSHFAAYTGGEGILGSFSFWLNNALGGWQNAFFVPGIISLISAVIIFTNLKDCPQSVGLPPIEEYHDDFTEEEKKHGFTERDLTAKELFVDHVLKNKFIWILAFANFFVYVCRYSMLDWGPTYVQEIKSGGIMAAGWGIFYLEIAGMVASVTMGWLSDVIGGRRGIITTLSMLPVIGAFLVIRFVPDLSFFLFNMMLMVIGFFIYPVVNLLLAQAMDLTSKKAIGTAGGFIGMFGYAGKMVMNVSFGSLQDVLQRTHTKVYSWDVIMYIILATGILAFILLSFTWKVKPKA